MHIAETLWANNITCAHRLEIHLCRWELLKHLRLNGHDTHDIVDAVNKIRSRKGLRFEYQRLPSPEVLAPPRPGPDRRELVSRFADDLQQLLHDVDAKLALKYCETMFAGGIYNVARLLPYSGLDNILRKWGWEEFDMTDFRDTLLHDRSLQCRNISVADVRALHGEAVLLQWLEQNVPNLKDPVRRGAYVQALAANNVFTVNRLVVRCANVAWLTKVGINAMDATDIASVLQARGKDNIWAQNARKAEREAENKRDRHGVLYQRLVSFRDNHRDDRFYQSAPNGEWQDTWLAPTEAFFCCQPFCALVMAPSVLDQLLCHCWPLLRSRCESSEREAFVDGVCACRPCTAPCRCVFKLGHAYSCDTCECCFPCPFLYERHRWEWDEVYCWCCHGSS
jgi:hypothetical protein